MLQGRMVHVAEALCTFAGRPTPFTVSSINGWTLQLWRQQWRCWIFWWAGWFSDGGLNQSSHNCSYNKNENVMTKTDVAQHWAQCCHKWMHCAPDNSLATRACEEHLLSQQQGALHLLGVTVTSLTALAALIFNLVHKPSRQIGKCLKHAFLNHPPYLTICWKVAPERWANTAF